MGDAHGDPREYRLEKSIVFDKILSHAFVLRRKIDQDGESMLCDWL